MSISAYGFGDPCLPTRVATTPSGSAWLHEIKHDGYRLMVRRTLDGVRIKTRRGYDWTDRFPLIIEAGERLRAPSFVVDGEGVILRPDGVADFDRLHSRRHGGEVQLLGFDLLELDGTDLRKEPLMHRKATLASLLRRESSWSSISRRTTAAQYSSTPASSGSKASSRSAEALRTSTGVAGHGSRLRTRRARQRIRVWEDHF
jgi:ATP-dependent DNA ligase